MGLSESAFLPGQLLSSIYSRDYRGVDYRSFSEPLVFREAAHNGILGDLSNSLMMCASRVDASREGDNSLAYVYSVQRRPEFATETRFDRSCSEITVSKEPLFSVERRDFRLGELFFEQVLESEHYHAGSSAIWQVIEARARGGGLLEVVPALRAWLAALLSYLEFERPADGQIDETLVPGRCIDAAPFNLIFVDKTAHFIDFEWRSNKDIPLGWIITRSVLWSLTTPGGESDAVGVTSAVQQLCATMDLSVRAESIEKWLRLEEKFQTSVSGTPCVLPDDLSAAKMLSPYQLLPDRIAEVQRLNTDIEAYERRFEQSHWEYEQSRADYESRLEQSREELMSLRDQLATARGNPSRVVVDYVIFRLLKRIAKLRLPLSPAKTLRFANSAAKRDPKR